MSANRYPTCNNNGAGYADPPTAEQTAGCVPRHYLTVCLPKRPQSAIPQENATALVGAVFQGQTPCPSGTAHYAARIY